MPQIKLSETSRGILCNEVMIIDSIDSLKAQIQPTNCCNIFLYVEAWNAVILFWQVPLFVFNDYKS